MSDALSAAAARMRARQTAAELDQDLEEALKDLEKPTPKAKQVTTAYVMQRNPRSHIRTITLVGAGGVGARMVPLLVKMLPEGARINVVDPDIVEPRNLWRQHFTEDDLGQPKAEVMANRYNGERGVEVAAFVEPFRCYSDATRNNYTDYMINTPLLIGAVDSRVARRTMIDNGAALWYIDAGNLTDRGQVLLHLRGGMIGKDLISGRSFSPTLNAADCMPEIFDPAKDEPETESCARPDLQTIAINSMAAVIAANAAYTLINEVPFWAAGWFFTPLSCEPIKIDAAQAYLPHGSAARTGPLYLNMRGIWHGAQ